MRAFLRARRARCRDVVTIRAHDGSIGRPSIATNGRRFESAGRSVQGARVRAGVELLPYHRFGEYKFERMGFAYKLAGMNTPSAGRSTRRRRF